MSLTGRSLISLSDLTLAEIVVILDHAEKMAKAIGFDDPATRVAAEPLDRIMATCFFEPSTRTRMSFACAMLRLGGQVIDMGGVQATSVTKGETLADTVRMVSAYSDIIIQRHPLAGSAKVAAQYATVPVINAGDGAREHPTQTLTDLFSIRRQKGRLDGLRIGLCGDLKYGRTVHSLAPVMAQFGSEVICIAPDALQMPEEVLGQCTAVSGTCPILTSDLAAALRDMRLDVLYMTRIQRERFEDPGQYERLRGAYVLTPDLMAPALKDLTVLHPLPRVNEIAVTVDADPRAQYFAQAAGGVPVRMALVALILGLAEERSASRAGFGGSAVVPARPEVKAEPAAQEVGAEGLRCTNPRCITATEPYLPASAAPGPGGDPRCAYCEQPLGAR